LRKYTAHGADEGGFLHSPIFMDHENKASPLKNWRFWAALIFVPIIGFAALRGGVTTYDVFLNWRSERLAFEAAKLASVGKSTEARQAATKSLDFNSANPEALRLLAKFQIASGEDLAALDAFKKLSGTRAFSTADAEAYARLAGRLEKWELAGSLLKVLRAGPKSVETPILESELAQLRGNIPYAEACLREAVEIDVSPKSRMLLVDFLIAHRIDLQTTPEIFESLVQTNRLQTPSGAQFLAIVLEKNLAPPAESPKWIQELRAHPHRTAPMLLVADTAEIRHDSAAKSRVAQEIFTRLKSAPLVDRQAAMLWLLKNGEPARAADLLQQSEAVADSEIFNAWLDALAGANRPAEVLAALEAPNHMKDWRKAIQRGRALRLSGRSTQADAAYNQAMLLAQENPRSALEVVAFFGKAEERSFFENSLSRLLLDGKQMAEAFKTLMPILRGWRDTPGLRKFCEILVAMPGLSEELLAQVHNEMDYCDLVLGRKVEPAHTKSHAAMHAGDMRYQITHALALLLAGQTELAVDELVIAKAPPGDPFLLARHKAAQAMALAATGDREQAQLHFQSLSAEFLSPQEIALVRSFLKKSMR
jgi:tetratricopeptide (TPR) repeat protein